MTRLIEKRDDRQVLYGIRECSAIRAPVVALADYIKSLSFEQSGGQHVRFIDVQPFKSDPEEGAAYPSACVFPEGEAEYEEEPFGNLSDNESILDDGTVLLLSAELTQTLSVHVWTNEEAQRDQLLMMLEDGLTPVEWMPGFILEMPHYYNARATFLPRQVAIEDTDQDNLRRYRKVIWRVQVRSPRFRAFNIPKLSPSPVVEVG